MEKSLFLAYRWQDLTLCLDKAPRLVFISICQIQPNIKYWDCNAIYLCCAVDFLCKCWHLLVQGLGLLLHRSLNRSSSCLGQSEYNVDDSNMMMVIWWVTQHIPTRHIPTRWEYDIMNRGGNVTLSYSHHIYIHHYIGMYGWHVYVVDCQAGTG